MEENREAAGTKEREDMHRTTSIQKQSSCSLKLSEICWIIFRCCVVAGLGITIHFMMILRQKQLKVLRALSPGVFTDYAVYNPSCQIPAYPAFHEDVRPYFEKIGNTNCSSLPLLTSVSRLGRNSTYVLNLHRSHSYHYGIDSAQLVCCYSAINTNHRNYTEGKCQRFDANVNLNPTADLFHVICNDDQDNTIYRMHHFLVPDKAETRRKTEQFKISNLGSEEFLSVMIIGLDGVSRLNFLRTMPETVKFMERNGWYTFLGYHKIQWNTLYNLNGPVLTGQTGERLKETCWPDDSGHLDECPYIWKNFSDKNYITAYGEDSPDYDSFEYAGFGGFKNQPTDYYLKPHMTVLGQSWKSGGTFEPCVGQRRAVDYLLEFAADFASYFVNSPMFSLFWTNTGHNHLNAPQMLDQRFITFFTSLESSGALNRSMIVFLSDHGFQYSKFRSTFMGSVEDAMPFLHIWLPKWFRNKHPSKARNLAKNKHRLVSHFDLHLTLMDVLGVKTIAEACPKCVSLFDLVPWNRGCSDAGIPGYCACDNYVEIPVNPLVQKMAEAVAARINDFAATYRKYLQEGFKCAFVSVKRVELARKQVLGNHYFGRKYIIHVVTSPNDAQFEAIVLLDTLEVQSILEYTQYEYRSFCMNSREGKKWCTCEPE